MAYDISVVNLHTGYEIDPYRIKDISGRVLRLIGASPAGLAITFVNSRLIRKLNNRFKSEDRATDVLSFALERPGAAPASPYCDIIISVDAACANAEKYSTTATEELVLYIIHGILHLFGYDDLTERGFKKMLEKQNGILRRLCRSRRLSTVLTPR